MIRIGWRICSVVVCFSVDNRHRSLKVLFRLTSQRALIAISGLALLADLEV